ncbi:MAG: tRNA (guanosine(46)-N7)-methyltransferase TrmB [Thermodesulfobacteriota bacterium]
MTIKPILDITEYRIPLEMQDVLKNTNELALEIGFGEGDFLIQMAKQRPDLNYIGIEIKRGRFKKAVNNLLKQEINNVKLLHIDATIALDEVFKPSTFIEVYINFPDPWPKDRHKKHRIINDFFLDKLSTIMKPGGLLEIASDHRDYIEHILTVFNQNSRFKNSFKSPGYTNKLTNRPLTKYEIEYRMGGREIFYLRYASQNNS